MPKLDIFRITGSFQMGRNKNQTFIRELVCSNEKEAREKLLSLLGSQHNVKRRAVKIEKIEKIKVSEAADPVVKGLVGGD
jgi:ribosomal protein L20A (L18A)